MKFESLVQILGPADVERAVGILGSNPTSVVSTSGPRWLAAPEAARILDAAAVAFLIRAGTGETVGVAHADRMQTPGHFRIELSSGDDDLMTDVEVARALTELTEFLCFGVEVTRLDLCFGVYDEPVLKAMLNSEAYRCEGVLRDRFYAAGRYWDGVLWSVTGADLDAYRSGDAELAAGYEKLRGRVERRIRATLGGQP